jgi:sterol desaturase/sphingolipid hydroxylase (fatty acid hydroxylase superfamily)
MMDSNQDVQCRQARIRLTFSRISQTTVGTAMDDTLYGSRDRRGNWTPNRILRYPPVFTWPARPIGFLRFVFGWPGYLLPWNLLYAATGIVFWLCLTPSMETMRTFSAGWIGLLLARNAAIILLFYGAFHLHLYIERRQGTRFKYNGKWPSNSNAAFLFGNQHIDNIIWNFASAVPIWTAFEAVTLWAYANRIIPYVDFTAHPLYCTVLLFLVPLWREFHFYLVHRLIHVRVLYRLAHKTHHYNVNPGPWSGLAMHPLEHLLYFTCVLIHWIVPSNPAHAVFNLVHAALSPAPGHTGFDRIVVGNDVAIDTTGYLHYLHHKLFECNYGGGTIPVDRWFGTFHDGSKQSEQRMHARLNARAMARRSSKAAVTEAGDQT